MKRRGFLSAIVGFFSAPAALAATPPPSRFPRGLLQDTPSEYCAWDRGIELSCADGGPTCAVCRAAGVDRIVNPPMIVDMGSIEEWQLDNLRPGGVTYLPYR